MGSLETLRTPAIIAAEINSIKDQTKRIVISNSIEIGRRLVEAKKLVGHGEWGKWLEGSVDYSQSTANNLMRIFEEYGSEQMNLLGDNVKSQTLGNLSYSQAVALLGVPQDEREKFIEQNDVENMSTRDLQKVIKERDEALKKLGIAKEIVDEKTKQANTFLEEKQKIEHEKRLTDQGLKEAKQSIKSLQEELEKQQENSKGEIQRLRDALSKAQNSGMDEDVEKLKEELEKAEAALEDSNRKINQLNQQLQNPVITTSVVEIERIPPDVERELEELRKNKQSTSPEFIKFEVMFENLGKNFEELLGLLAEIDNVDAETGGKLRHAVSGLIRKMVEHL